jgi:hypothetical protein
MLEERFDLLLQRAPIDAGALLQTLDGRLIKARTRIEPTRYSSIRDPGITLIGAKVGATAP